MVEAEQQADEGDEGDAQVVTGEATGDGAVADFVPGEHEVAGS